jgi:4-hydroxybenzoate polyprenyltransferase
MFQKLLDYAKLLRLHKPIGIFLLLWPTLIALWLAEKRMPDLIIMTIFVFGVVIMRSAGCVINDILDRGFDAHIPRTKLRPLVLGKVSVREACIIFISLIVFGFILVLQLNTLTILLSSVALMLTALYPLMKRYTHFPQIVLGAAFGWSIPMAFSAETNSVPLEAWLLFIATLCWVIAYDTQYAMVDREDDIKIGIKSTAIFFGRWDRLTILGLQGLSLLMLAWIGKRFHLNGYFYLGLMVAAGCAWYQFKLTVECDPPSCFKAFLNNNYLGLSLFLGTVLGV